MDSDKAKFHNALEELMPGITGENKFLVEKYLNDAPFFAAMTMAARMHAHHAEHHAAYADGTHHNHYPAQPASRRISER